MNTFKEIPPEQFSNVFDIIGKEWMLITAAKEGRVNTMTASWGCAGVLWNRPVCVCFIRPQRYTYEFTESADTLSLSFFDREYRPALAKCGAVSGRDCDKFALSGLEPSFEGDTPYISQARLALICRKLYTDDIKESGFVLPELLENYTARDFHRVYICEIIKTLSRE